MAKVYGTKFSYIIEPGFEVHVAYCPTKEAAEQMRAALKKEYPRLKYGDYYRYIITCEHGIDRSNYCNLCKCVVGEI